MGNIESPQLMTGDAETGRSLVDNFEQLHELSQQIKAKGKATPEDILMALGLVTQASEIVDRGVNKNVIKESRFNISEYSIDKDIYYSVSVINGEPYFRLKHQGKDVFASDLLSIQGEVINKEPLTRNGVLPCRYQEKTIFQFAYSQPVDDKTFVFVNAKGEELPFPTGKNNDDTVLAILDKNKELRFVQRVNSVGTGNDDDTRTILALDGKPVSAKHLYITNTGIVNGKLAYVAKDEKSMKVGYGNEVVSVKLNGELNELLSFPFEMNGKVYYIDYSNYKKRKGMSWLQVIDFETKEDVSGEDCYYSFNVEAINSVAVADGKVYVVLKIDGVDTLYCADPAEEWKFKEVPLQVFLNFRPGAEVDGMEVREIGGKIFCTYVEVGVFTTEIVDGKDYKPERVFKGDYLITKTPKTIGGKTGTIFYIDDDITPGASKWLLVDNQPVDLLNPKDQVFDVSSFDIANDKIFISKKFYPDDNNREVTNDVLYIDEVKSEYVFDKIIKVVFHEEKYFVIAVNGTEMVVKEIKV